MKTLLIALLTTFAFTASAETLTAEEAAAKIAKEITKDQFPKPSNETADLSEYYAVMNAELAKPESTTEWRKEVVSKYSKCKVAISKTDGYYSDNFQKLKKDIDTQIDEKFDALEIRKQLRTEQNSFTEVWLTLSASVQEAVYASCVE